jgi:putative transposase
MTKKGHTDEQIVAVLRQVEAGARVVEVCRKSGISEATYYLWKRQYSGVGGSELRELRQLREENGRLKRLVADLSMDRQNHQLLHDAPALAAAVIQQWVKAKYGVRTHRGGASHVRTTFELECTSSHYGLCRRPEGVGSLLDYLMSRTDFFRH